MASNQTNTTTVTGLLKNVYANYVERQQNLEHKFYDEISKSSKNYNAGGKGWFGAINEYGNESVGAISEEEQFRSIDAESYQQFQVVPKVLVAPIQISGLVAEAANQDVESFADVLVDALDLARERLKKDMNRQYFGKGTGKLASPNGSPASNVTSFSVDSAQYLRANMVIDIFNGATKTVTSIRISDVDKQGNVVYFSTSIGAALASTYELVKEHIRDSAASDGKEMMGLDGIVDDSTLLTTFQALDATAKRIWRSVRIDGASGNLTSDLLQRLEDDINVLSGEEVDMIVMHPKQRRKYLDIVVPQKRYADGKLDAGFSKLSFNGRDLFLDPDCQDAQVYALCRKHLMKFVLKDVSMGTLEDAPEFLRQSGYDIFQAYWRAYMNFGCDKRNAMGKIVSLAKPSGVS